MVGEEYPGPECLGFRLKVTALFIAALLWPCWAATLGKEPFPSSQAYDQHQSMASARFFVSNKKGHTGPRHHRESSNSCTSFTDVPAVAESVKQDFISTCPLPDLTPGDVSNTFHNRLRAIGTHEPFCSSSSIVCRSDRSPVRRRLKRAKFSMNSFRDNAYHNSALQPLPSLCPVAATAATSARTMPAVKASKNDAPAAQAPPVAISAAFDEVIAWLPANKHTHRHTFCRTQWTLDIRLCLSGRQYKSDARFRQEQGLCLPVAGRAVHVLSAKA